MIFSSKFVLFVTFFIFSLYQSAVCNESIEMSCSSNEDCSSFQDKLVLSKCSNHSCECIRIKTKARENCVPRQISLSNKIGDKCPCNIPNTHCLLNQTCACEDNFIATPDELRCIKNIVPLGSFCEMNEQCVKFDRHATCRNSTCQCLENFALHDNNCRSVVRVGQSCQSNVQCRNTTENVSCFEHRCTCDKNFVASTDGNHCLPQTFFHQRCKENIQCDSGFGPGTLCDHGLCICDSAHRNITDNGKVICQRLVKYGDECREHSDCSHYLSVPTMVCSNHKCACRDGHELYDAYSKECVKSAKSGATVQFTNIIGLVIIVALTSVFIRWEI